MRGGPGKCHLQNAVQLVKGGVCRAGELPNDGGRDDILGLEMDAEDIVV